jgi:hypothetical protein
VRIVVSLFVVAALVLVGQRALGGAKDGLGDRGLLPSLPQGAPAELQDVFGKLSDARRSALGGRGLLRRASADAAPTPSPPFADAGSPRRIARVKAAVRASLRKDSTPQVRLHVAAWQGVVVSGDRAVVRADVERLVRSHSGRMAQPSKRLTLGLLATGGWKVVTTQ